MFGVVIFHLNGTRNFYFIVGKFYAPVENAKFMTPEYSAFLKVVYLR